MRRELVLSFLALAASRVSLAQTAARPSQMERAVAEFKAQTRDLGMRTDGPAGVRQNSRAKQSWHGRLFENFRNDYLDALPHEIRQRGGDKSLLRRNQFGFHISSPTVLSRLFDGGLHFSLSFEGMRERISRTQLRTIPTMAERDGNFGSVIDQSGNLLPIYDPGATRSNPAYDAARPVSADNLQYLRDPFPVNRIPESRLDTVARRALALYPEPNAAAGPFFRNNFFIHSPETNTANGMIFKVDHSFRSRHRIETDFAFSNGLLGAAQWFPTAANPGPADRTYANRRGSVEHTFTLSPRTVNNLGFSAASSVSESGGDQEPFPLYQFSPYTAMGRAWPVSKHARNTFTWNESFSTRRGNHSLRVAAWDTRVQVNTFSAQYPAGDFRFSEGLTSLPGIVSTGHAFASFVLGLADYAEASVVTAPSYFRRSESQVSFHDQYQVKKGLTLNFGVNVVHNSPRTEKYNRQSTVQLETLRADGAAGALVAANRDGFGRAFAPGTFRLEPSASLAFNPAGDPRTVVRLAFSRNYTVHPIYFGQWGTQGFSGYPTFISPNVQLEPAVTLSQGLPGLTRPLPDLRPDAADNTIADLMDITDRLPMYQSASFSFERELLSSIVIAAGYSYSGGKNLLVGNGAANPNAIRLDNLTYRDRLNDEAFNRSLRPFPQYKGFDVYSGYPIGRYRRDGGFIRVDKRASKNLSLSASYSFSKQMDDYSGPSGKQDFYHRELEWSQTVGHEPHRLNLNYVYELPIGAGKPFLATRRWQRYLIDGWSVGGTSFVQGGSPLHLRPQFNNTGGVVSGLNVNAVAGVDAHVSNPGPELWFNPAAFDQPPDFTIGNVSRTHPSLRGPIFQEHDLSLNKRFAVDGERTLELSVLALNFVNQANWNSPDTTIGPASAPNVNAGKIIGSRGGRVIQLGLRFSF